MYTALAPAKINLYLHVTGRRADGYHELDSLIEFADIYGIIEKYLLRVEELELLSRKSIPDLSTPAFICASNQSLPQCM